MGIMVAPAGIANAAPGDTATASIRNMTAHALFRIIIRVIIHNCDYLILDFVAGPATCSLTCAFEFDGR